MNQRIEIDEIIGLIRKKYNLDASCYTVIPHVDFGDYGDGVQWENIYFDIQETPEQYRRSIEMEKPIPNGKIEVVELTDNYITETTVKQYLQGSMYNEITICPRTKLIVIHDNQGRGSCVCNFDQIKAIHQTIVNIENVETNGILP